jgi:Flp pilus assembly CpaF family ATPase
MRADVIPISILTGFLGSGKTTILGHLLRQSGFSRTAVIINEFGEVGLDHELVEANSRPAASAAKSAPTWRKPCKTCCSGVMRASARRLIAL